MDTSSVRSSTIATTEKSESTKNFVFITLGLVFDIYLFEKPFFKPDVFGNEIDIFQKIIATAFVETPLLYLQIVFSQYTELNAIHIKQLAPISRGLGCTMFIACILKLIELGITQCDLLLYTLMAVQKEIPWNHCHKKTNCWSPTTECNEKRCLDKKHVLSGYIYWTNIFLKDTGGSDSINVGAMQFNRLSSLLFTWTIMFVISVASLRKYRLIVKFNFIIATIILLSLTVILFLFKNPLQAFALVSSYSFNHFRDIQSWQRVFADVIESSAFGRAIHINDARNLSPQCPSDFVSFLISFIHFFLALFSFVFISTITINIMEKAHLDKPKGLFMSQISNIFVLLPNGLGMISASQLWSVLFFIMCILITANNQLIHLALIEKSISDAFPRMVRYKSYTVFLTILCVIFCTLIFLCEGMWQFNNVFSSETIRSIELINTLLFSLTLCYMYGVQKVCDDIHFMQGRQPTIYWKICWYLIPLYMCFTFYNNVIFFQCPDRLSHILHWVVVCLTMLPIPILAIVELVIHTRNHNIVGVFRAKERWGPPDPEERHFRRLFNPREEIRFRRRREICKHFCLTNSRAVDMFVEEEEMIRKFEYGSQDNLESVSSLIERYESSQRF